MPPIVALIIVILGALGALASGVYARFAVGPVASTFTGFFACGVGVGELRNAQGSLGRVAILLAGYTALCLALYILASGVIL